MGQLTDRQQEVLTIIESEIRGGFGFPTVREIAEKLGVNNPSGVLGHLNALIKKGYVRKQSNFALTAEALGDGEIPLVATIPAGLPAEASDHAGDVVRFDRPFFSKGDVKAVKITGDSMSGDSIRDGDIGLIKLQNRINKNDIAVVRVDGEVTLKRVRRNQNKVELVPSNPEFQVKKVDPSMLEVIGKLVGIVRKT